MTSPTTMAPQNAHSAGRRAEVLHLLREASEPLGITQIADRLAVHVNTVRFHLQTLVGNGQVERVQAEHATPGRPPQLFRATPGMDPMGPRHYRVLAEALTAQLATEKNFSDRATQAGRTWGHLQASTSANAAQHPEPAASIEQLVSLLDDLGFAPEQATAGDPSQIGLRNCPFLEVAVDRSEVVCPVHLGLMQGAMEAWDAPVTVSRLEPFVEPGLCMAHLRTTESS